MPYAANNQISQVPIPGGIEITELQYAEALEGMLEGKVVSIDGGFSVAFPPEPEPEPEPEPIDPLELSLSKRQVNAALILAGHTDPDAFIEAAIATIDDETQRALALNDWRFAPYFKRDHPLLNDADILAAAGFTPGDVDGLWIAAINLPA